MKRFDGILRAVEGEAGMVAGFIPIKYEPDSHSANLLELDNGDLLCVWFSGSGEGNPDTNILMSRLPAGGNCWEEPQELAADLTRSEQNPVLFQEPGGRLWLLHTSNEPHTPSTAHVVCRLSDDRGQTWGEPFIRFDEPGFYLRHPLVVLHNGDWLLPAYYSRKGGHYSVVKISSDQGKTWLEHEIPGSVGRVQMSVLQLGDGSLYAMFRSRESDRIYTSTSGDNGRTWSVPQKSQLPNNNSSMQLASLPDGEMALIFNPATLERDQFRWVDRTDDAPYKKAVRTPLAVAISADGGQTWPWVRNVQVADQEYRDNEVGYSYPSIIYGTDGQLHMAYSYLRKAIRYVRVDPAWVRDGERQSLY